MYTTLYFIDISVQENKFERTSNQMASFIRYLSKVVIKYDILSVVGVTNPLLRFSAQRHDYDPCSSSRQTAELTFRLALYRSLEDFVNPVTDFCNPNRILILYPVITILTLCLTNSLFEMKNYNYP
jgi:hypothetical protein